MIPMPADAFRPMCFIAMPFGKRAPAGRRKPLIDFDAVHAAIDRAARDAGLDPIRADVDPVGGFVHRSMLERLLVAEYVVADVTLANPNVMYEVGVRHGASDRATLLVCATRFVPDLPFDLRPLRVLPYDVGADGSFEAAAADGLAAAIGERLGQARRGALPLDNPLMQVTSWKPSGRIEHSKTDAFLQRVQATSALGERVRAAVQARDDDRALGDLRAIEAEVVDVGQDVAHVHSVLIGVFLGYREKQAYAEMVRLFGRFPNELKQTAVAREQYAFALNRLAEAADRTGDRAAADRRRTDALTALDGIPERNITSETFGIRGRIFKDWHDALRAGLAASPDPAAAARADALLQTAIEAYEQGLRADLRDSYPGVNAVTLRLLRGLPEDRERLRTLVPVVRFAVDAAPAPKNTEERWWQTATRLELATADRDWDAARSHLQALRALIPQVQSWMVDTTRGNLERQKQVFARQGEPAREMDEVIAGLVAV